MKSESLEQNARKAICLSLKYLVNPLCIVFLFSSPSTADSYPLNDSNPSPLYWGVIVGTCGLENFPSSRPACNRVLDLVKREDFSIIECIYGPINRDGTGWRFYHFWIDEVPQDMASFATPGEEHPFLILGAAAVHACPETSDEAEALLQAGRLKG